MSFLQSSEWNFASIFQNPQAQAAEFSFRKTSYDQSNLSTRKDSNDSIDFKFRFKTQVCKYWLNGQYCPFQGFCSFAHGSVQRRYRQDLSSKYKTKLCKNFMNNSCCPYGTRCQFLHPQNSKQQTIPKNKYQKLLNLAQQNLPLFFIRSKRLQSFRQLTDLQTIKQLFGQDYSCPHNATPFSRLNLNGKPRLYSI